MTWTAHTEGIRIDVSASYAPEDSAPGQNRWCFHYDIRITNEGQEPVQLLRRHWIIRDALERVEEVEGAGVVGQQPRLRPGESFAYRSGCVLRTPLGWMRGTYLFVRGTNEPFRATIPEFTLHDPGSVH